MTYRPSPLLDDAFSRLQSAASHAAPSHHNTRPAPTDAQARAGNYKAGRVVLHGLPIKVENDRGSIRAKTDGGGKHWENRMAAHYGEFTGTRGNDGDPVDVFIGLWPESRSVWVINQGWPDGGFDEHKVCLGFVTEQQARDGYLMSYDRGWTGLQSIVACDVDQLCWWLARGDKTQPFSIDQIPTLSTRTMEKTFWTSDAQPVGKPLNTLMYEMRGDDRGGLLLDAVSLGELMADPELQGAPLLDAMVVEVSRLTQKMNVLQTVMAAAGAAFAPTGYQISDPVKLRGTMQVAVLFTLADGQTVTVWFHNPDTTPTKLMPLDELISWKFLLNKKDITIVVAPERGRDLNVREVARRIMRLAERNAPAFAKANAKLTERIEAEKAIDTEIVVLSDRLGELQGQIVNAKVRQEQERRDMLGAIDRMSAEVERVKVGARAGDAEASERLEWLLNEIDDTSDILAGPGAGRGRVSWAQWQALRAGEAARAAPAAAAAAEEPAPAADTIDPLDAARARMKTSEYKTLRADILGSIGMVASIDAGTAPGYERSLFVSSATGKISRVAKRDQVLAGLLLALVAYAQKKFKKPAIAAKNLVWGMVPDWEMFLPLFESQAAAPAAAAPAAAASPAFMAFHVDGVSKFTVVVKNDPTYGTKEARGDAIEATRAEFGGGAVRVKEEAFPLDAVPEGAWQGKGGDWAWFLRGYLGETAPAADFVPAITKQKDEFQNVSYDVTLPDGSTRNIQRMDSASTMGLPGWHDESGYLAETKEDAIKALLAKYPAVPPAPAAEAVADVPEPVAEPAPAAEVPEFVRKKVSDALQELREIRAGVDAAISLEAKFGSKGRYELDAIENRAADIARAQGTLEEFRTNAAAKGIDAEAFIASLGGVPDLTPSADALAWKKAPEPEVAEAAAPAAAVEPVPEAAPVVEPEPVAAVEPEPVVTPAPAKGDVSYIVGDMFTTFFPNTSEGEEAWKLINATEGSEGGKVFNQHADSVIAQLQAAGYTVSKTTAAAASDISDDDLLAELEAPAADPVPAEVEAPQETEGNVMEQYIKIAADSIAELRKVDVDRVLGSVRADNIDGVTREALGAWISEQRPDLADEVADVLAELAAPAVEPLPEPLTPENTPAPTETPAEVDPALAADRAYLESLIDGTGDLLAEDTFERLEPLFTKYEADAEMTALLERAADAYGDAAVAAAQAALATPA